MSLRNRILLLVALGLLVATIPLGVMGLAMVGVATDRVLGERLALTRATAQHLAERLAGGWAQLEDLAVRARAGEGGDLSRVRRDFATLVPQMPLFSGGVVLVDRDRRPVIAVPASARRVFFSLTGLDVLEEAMRDRHRQTSSLIRTRDGLAIVIFAVPVLRGPEEVVGAVAGLIDLRQPTLLSFLNGLAIGRTGHAAIVEQDGIVLASTDDTEVFSRNEHPEFFARFIANGLPLIGSAVEETGDHRRDTHVMAFAPLPGVPWGLGIGQSEDETFGPIRRLRDRVIAFELIVLLAALLFAWVDTTAVVAPLQTLRRAAERIAGGDLRGPIEVRRGDEIGMLGRSFEVMRSRLLQSLEENTRLQERLQSLAMLEERERIAREMHDSVGQVLGYVNTKTQAVRAFLDAGKVEDARAHLIQLDQAAREVYADLREAILSLRTTTSPTRPLRLALAEYVRRFTEVSGVETTLIVEGDPDMVDLPPTTEVHLVRIVQEALTNVRKHARARHAWVRFTVAGGRRIVAVEDDGVGFTPHRRAIDGMSGFGLQTMRERAQAIGAGMTIGPRVPGGTVVTIVLPGAEGAAGDARSAG